MASGATISLTGGTTMTQVVAGLDTIRATDFNNARTNINALLGAAADVDLGTFTSANTFGYSQGGAGVSAAVVGELVYADNSVGGFKRLQDDVQSLCAFLGQAPRVGVGVDVTTTDTIAATTWNNLMLNIKDCWDNRFTAANTSVITDDTVVFNSVWGVSLEQTTTWTWDNEAECRAFFNAGGGVGASSSRTGGSISPENTGWSDLLSSMGNVFMKYNSTEGATGTGAGLGFYDLTTSYQLLFTKFGLGSYVNNFFKVEGRVNSVTNPTEVSLKYTWSEQYANNIDGTVSLNSLILQPNANGSTIVVIAGTGSASAISSSGVVAPLYVLTESSATVDEGNAVTINVTTTNFGNGLLYWTVQGTGAAPTASADFVEDSGNVTITDNAGSFLITTAADLATEGAETFRVQLRTNSFIGNVVAISNVITINDTTIIPPTYSITPSVFSVDEGNSVTINVTTTDVGNAVLYWNTLGASSADFVEDSGNVTITDDAGLFIITTVADLATEGAETFAVELRIDSPAGNVVATSANITINDTSITPPTYAITPTANTVNENASITFNVTTTDVGNAVLYWTVLGIGENPTSNADLVASSGNVTIINNTGSFIITTVADLTTEGAETFAVELRTGSIGGTVVATSSNVTVVDTSTTPITFVITPTIDENVTIVFNVTTTNFGSGTLYWNIIGTGNNSASNADFVSHNGNFSIESDAGSFAVTTVADFTTEGSELFAVQLRTGGPSGNLVATSGNISINDTSITTPIYAVTANISSVNEGNAVTFNVATGNYGNGLLYWNTIFADAADFDQANGNVTVTNDIGSFTVTTVADLTTEGSEVFAVQLLDAIAGNVLATSGNVTINDTSTTIYTVTANISSVNEGNAVTIDVTVTNFGNGELYWTVSGTGASPASNVDFVEDSGNVTITDNAGSFIITTVADSTTEGEETFIVQLRTGSISGNVVANSAVIVINDTSRLPSEPHRYWRLLLNAQTEGGEVALEEIEWLQNRYYRPIQGGTITSTSTDLTYTVEYLSNKVWNEISSFRWQSNEWNAEGDVWVQIDLGEGNAAPLEGVMLVKYNGDSSTYPANFVVQHSDNGVTWTEEWRQENVAVDFVANESAADNRLPLVYTNPNVTEFSPVSGFDTKGLVLWMKSYDGSYVDEFTTSAANGDTVYTMLNHAPGSNVIVQQSDTNLRPIYIDDGISNLPYLNFDNEAEYHFEDFTLLAPGDSTTHFAGITGFLGMPDIPETNEMYAVVGSTTASSKNSFYFRSNANTQIAWRNVYRTGNLSNVDPLVYSIGQPQWGPYISYYIDADGDNYIRTGTGTVVSSTAQTTAQLFRNTGNVAASNAGSHYKGKFYELVLKQPPYEEVDDYKSYTNAFYIKQYLEGRSLYGAPYVMSPANATITEGSTITVNVKTRSPGIANGTLYWSIIDAESADFTATSGNVTITDNSGSFTITTVADLTSESTYQFRVDLKSNNGPFARLLADTAMELRDTSVGEVGVVFLTGFGPSDSDWLLDESGRDNHIVSVISESGVEQANTLVARQSTVEIGNTAVKFGTGAFGSATSSDYIGYVNHNTDFIFDGAFTVECWAKMDASTSTSGGLLSKYTPNEFDGGDSWHMRMAANQVIEAQLSLDGYNSALTLTGNVTRTPNIWQHYVLERNDEDVVRLYLDGVIIAQGNLSGTLYDNWDTPLFIGSSPASTIFSVEANWAIDEIRITKGIAQYNGAFTPPTEPFPRVGASNVEISTTNTFIKTDETGNSDVTLITDTVSFNATGGDGTGPTYGYVFNHTLELGATTGPVLSLSNTLGNAITVSATGDPGDSAVGNVITTVIDPTGFTTSVTNPVSLQWINVGTVVVLHGFGAPGSRFVTPTNQLWREDESGNGANIIATGTSTGRYYDSTDATFVDDGNIGTPTSNVLFGSGSLGRLSTGGASVANIAHNNNFIFANAFTVECWAKMINSGANRWGGLVSKWGYGGAGNSWIMFMSTGLTVEARLSLDGINTALTLTGNVDRTFDTWQHYALERNDEDVVRLYLDGNVIAQGNLTGALYNNNPSPLIYGGGLTYLSSVLAGWRIDEVRITNGLAQYNGAFTPPTTPFPRANMTTIIPASTNTFIKTDETGNSGALLTTDTVNFTATGGDGTGPQYGYIFKHTLDLGATTGPSLTLSNTFGNAITVSAIGDPGDSAAGNVITQAIDPTGFTANITNPVLLQWTGTASNIIGLASDYSINDSQIGSQSIAQFKLQNDGDIKETTATLGEIDVGDWITPKSAAGSNYEARATIISGPTGTAQLQGTFGTWEDLGSDRTWGLVTVQDGFSEVMFRVEIRQGVTVLANTNVSMSVDSQVS